MPRMFLAALLLLVSGRLPAQEPQLRFDRLAPPDLEPYVQRILAAGRDSLEHLLAEPGPRTVGSTLRRYDNFRIGVNRARVVAVLRNVHPDPAVRAAAGHAEALLQAFNEERRTDRRIHDMLRAVDTTEADAEVRMWVRRELENYRRESLDRSPEVRARIARARQEIARLERAWSENLRDDTITIAFGVAELEGLPAEWLAERARGPGDSVLVAGEALRTVTTRAVRAPTRERAMLAQLRLRPNHFVLDTLLHARHELGTLAGYRSYAEYQLESTMAGSPERVRTFLDELRRLSEPALRKLIASRAAATAGAADTRRTSIPLHDLVYGGDDMSDSEVSGGTSELRAYLPYARVRDGLLELVRELFALDFRAAPDLPAWHETVEPYRVFEDDSLIAYVYLDLHWRAGRSPVGASASTIRQGVRNRAISEVVLIGGMVRPRRGEPALLGPRGMATVFHEFGHLLHYLFAVRSWFATSGLPDEFDFREVPSVLFSAWAQDSAVVSRFARHYQTGAPPPAALLRALRPRPEELNLIGQWLARTALELHDREPDDMHAVARQAFVGALPRDLPVTIELPTADIHPEIAMPQIGGGYAAALYTYQWSSVIARDLLTRFERGLLDRDVVHAYRTHILEPGRSRPASQLIEDFLGRAFTLDPWARSLAEN